MKSLAQMAAEVEAVNREKGWYDTPVSFGEAMALLHSEVSEALEAYRDHGLSDMTIAAKPEGVGSEFADVLIRLLDYSTRFGVDLDAQIGPGGFGISDSFGENCNVLHMLICAAYHWWEDAWDDLASRRRWHQEFSRVYSYLLQLSSHHGIDLDAEYERKLAFNKTRPYRHGGRAL